MKSYKVYLLLFFLLAAEGYAHHPILEGFIRKKIFSGRDYTSMAEAPDGRIFIAERTGRVLIVRDGELLDKPFMELIVDTEGERGIQSIVFDPDFETNNYIYIYYTVLFQDHNRISRFTANGDVVLSGSETILMDLDVQEAHFHNGGGMCFGTDGRLYAATGDGAWVTDAPQSLNTLRGKVLRLNKDGSIPTDNPFYNQLTGKHRAIYAYGLRSPFSMACNPRTGKIYLNDVGRVDYEEINEILPGSNYGWPLIEGYYKGGKKPDNYVDPTYVYSHDVGCAIVGAGFLEFGTTNIPEQYHGLYVFGEYCTSNVLLFDPETETLVDTLAQDIISPISYIASQDGSIYCLSRGGIRGDNAPGGLWKISYVGSGEPYILTQTEDELYSVGEDALMGVEAGGEGTLSYFWHDEDDNVIDTGGPELTFSSVALADSGNTYYCVVQNEFGSDTSNTFTLRVTDNQRPEAYISTPEDSIYYSGGDQIVIKGYGVDAENGPMDPSQLSWEIIFHHDDHVHPGLSLSGDDSLTFTAPIVGETSTNVWYEIVLEVTDDVGLVGRVSYAMLPNVQKVFVYSAPEKVNIGKDGTPTETVFSVEGVVGMLRSLEAPQLIEKENEIYVFSHWNTQEESNILNFAIPDSVATIIAYYDKKYQNTGEIIDVFPNPSNGEFKFLVNSEVKARIPYVIYNSSSQNINEGFLNLLIGENLMEVNLSERYPPGMYYLHVLFESGVVIKKITKL